MISSARYDEYGDLVVTDADGIEWHTTSDSPRLGHLVQEWVAAGNTVTPYTPPVPVNANVNAERDRRIVAGKTFSVVGGISIPATGTQFDLSIFEAKKSEADAKKAAGDTSASIVFRGGDNVIHTLTPDQMLDLYSQGVGFIQAVMEVSWAMKDGTGNFTGGIPTDPPYTDDSYWP